MTTRRNFLAGLMSLPVAAVVPQVFEELVARKVSWDIGVGDTFTIAGVQRLTVPSGVSYVRLQSFIVIAKESNVIRLEESNVIRLEANDG